MNDNSLIMIRRPEIECAIGAIQKGLEAYQFLAERLHSDDVSIDEVFQDTFNAVFGMDRLSLVFKREFYIYMERNKKKMPSFVEILYDIYRQTGRIEASVASKLAVTFNPGLPVWDSAFMRHVGLIPPVSCEKDRLTQIVSVYCDLILWFKRFLCHEEGRRIIRMFDHAYPKSSITMVKKVEFILWQIIR